MGVEFQFYKMKRAGWSILWMHLILLNHTLKNGHSGNFTLVYFTTLKKTGKKMRRKKI